VWAWAALGVELLGWGAEGGVGWRKGRQGGAGFSKYPAWGRGARLPGAPPDQPARPRPPQVTRVDASARRIDLALSSKKGAVPEAEAAAAAAAPGGAVAKDGAAAKAGGLPGGYEPGDVVESGVVKAVEGKGDGAKGVVLLEVKGEREARGRGGAVCRLQAGSRAREALPQGSTLSLAPAALPPGKDGAAVAARLPLAHLADHPAAAEKLADQLRPGVALGPLLVLQLAAAEDKAKGGGKKKRGGKKGLLVGAQAS
jgi:hypothetical protein